MDASHIHESRLPGRGGRWFHIDDDTHTRALGNVLPPIGSGYHNPNPLTVFPLPRADEAP